MSEARDLASLAALLADPARARMLTALMSGMALTATELAAEGGVAASTASEHLGRLTTAGVLAVEKQGRHRYFRLFDAHIAELLEDLTQAATQRGPVRRIGPVDPALRDARVCYDHLAGARGVRLLDRLREAGILGGHDGVGVSPAGEALFQRFGIPIDGLQRTKRPLCRTCLDWTERRPHLGGALGAAILGRILEFRWARREKGSRVLTFTVEGERGLEEWFGTRRLRAVR